MPRALRRHDQEVRATARVTEERIAITILTKHRNDRRQRRLRTELSKRERCKRLHARVVIAAEFGEFLARRNTARFTQHARGLRTNLCIAIIKQLKHCR